MNQATATALIIIATGGLLLSAATFTIAAMVTIRAKRNVGEARQKLADAKEELRKFLTALEKI